METQYFKEKLRIFFNRGWIFKAKQKNHLNLTTNIDELFAEYQIVFNIKMSKAQIIEFLVSEELKRVKGLPPYKGPHAFVDLFKRRKPFGEFGELYNEDDN